MERRQFLYLAFGAVAGSATLAAAASAAPLPPALSHEGMVPSGTEAIEPAVVSQHEVDHLKPEPVRWHHYWHRHWNRRWHWHRRWHRRHWGWRHHWHRHWHHRHWRW